MNKTENAAEVGKHKFELAGLGKAPFRFVGCSENRIVIGTGADAYTKAGGSCDYCSTGISTEFHIISADGKRSKVGCNCIEKVGDRGLLQAYRTSPEYRKAQAAKRAAKASAVFVAIKGLLDNEAVKAFFSAQPHRRGFTNRETGAALTDLDQVVWLFNNSGASGRQWLLKDIQTRLAGAMIGGAL